jgi:hypothetical protein
MTSPVLPNFFILGAAKAGTTTLYEVLKQHPQVYLSYVKEPMFFSHDENYRQGLGWYSRTFFPAAHKYPLRGEATPHYLYWAEKVAPRIREAYGGTNLKFVIILRDPVQRAYSWYWNMVKEGKEDLPFAEALEKEAERLRAHWDSLYATGSMVYGYYRGGCYASQIEEYFKYFSRESFYFLLQEDLKDLKHGTFPGLLEFLGVERQVEFKPVVANPAATPRSRTLHRWLHGPSALKELVKKIIPLRWRYHFKVLLTEANLQAISYPRLDEVLAAELRKRYQGEVERLEIIIGRDLSSWKG